MKFIRGVHTSIRCDLFDSNIEKEDNCFGLRTCVPPHVPLRDRYKNFLLMVEGLDSVFDVVVGGGSGFFVSCSVESGWRFAASPLNH